MRLWIKYWLPVLAWMAMIFIASTRMLSADQTSRIIGPVLRFFFPDIEDAAIQSVQFAFRKAAHATEYAVLALLVWRARVKPSRGDHRPWSWNEAGIAFAVSLAYAISDEIHQNYVPSRQGMASDVVIDAAGAAAALLLLRALAGWRNRQAGLRPASARD